MSLNFTKSERACRPIFLKKWVPVALPLAQTISPFCYPGVSTSSFFKYPKLFCVQKLSCTKERQFRKGTIMETFYQNIWMGNGCNVH